MKIVGGTGLQGKLNFFFWSDAKFKMPIRYWNRDTKEADTQFRVQGKKVRAGDINLGIFIV